MPQDRSPSGFFNGIIIGSLIGTIAGLIIAPRTGKETRKIIKKSADALPEIAEDLSSSLQLQADRLSQSTIEQWDQTLAKLQEAIIAGIEASQLQQQILAKSQANNSSSLPKQKKKGPNPENCS